MKKFLTLLFILTLLIALCSFLVQAESETIYCERCNQDVSNDDWQNWNFIGGDLAGGHYRLTDDFFGQTNTIRIPEGTIVCLDLCGKTYATTKIRMFNVMGTFTIMDSVGGGTMITSTARSRMMEIRRLPCPMSATAKQQTKTAAIST